MASRKRRSETAVHIPSPKARRTEEETEPEPPENEKGTMTELRTTDTAIMTDVTSTSIQADTQYRDSLEKNLCRLREENAELRDHASQVKKCSPCERCLKDDDQQVKFYTGLPTYVSLMAIFRFVSVSVSASRNPQSLPLFQQFLLVLMKLRLIISAQLPSLQVLEQVRATVSRSFHHNY